MKQINNPLYVWNGKFTDNDLTPHTVIKDLHNPTNKSKHNPSENARNLARLIEYSFPSNANDIMLDAIANEILIQIKSNPDLLDLDFIIGHIRYALVKLADMK